MLPSYNHTCMFMKVPRNWIENLEPACRCTEYETLKQASNSTQKSWAWRKRINPPSYKSVSSNYYLDIQHITQFDTWYIYEYTYLLDSLSARINEVCLLMQVDKKTRLSRAQFQPVLPWLWGMCQIAEAYPDLWIFLQQFSTDSSVLIFHVPWGNESQIFEPSEDGHWWAVMVGLFRMLQTFPRFQLREWHFCSNVKPLWN